MQAETEADETYTLARFTSRSFEDEFGSTLDGDLQLLQVAIIGIAVYTYIAISNCRDGCVGSRLALTIGGTPPPLPCAHGAQSLPMIHDGACVSCCPGVPWCDSYGS